MVNLKRALLLFTVVFFTTNLFAVQGQQAELSTPEEIQEYSEHHVKDDYYFSLFSNKKTGKHYGFPLPVILIDKGLKIFSSAEFHHGETVVEKDGQHYRLYHGKIYKTDAAGTITYNEKHYPTNEKPWDFSITKNVTGLFIATIILVWAFLSLAKTYKKSPNNLPVGLGRFLEPLVLFVRDEMAQPNIGHRYKEFTPYLLAVFFLIFLLNLMGLTPIGFNVTGNITITFGLAIITFLITNLKANKAYWKHIFWMPGVPVPFKIILAPIEVIGMFTKPFSLMLRLFANMTAGHFVLMGFIAVIYLFQNQLTLGGSIGVSMLLTLIIFALKLLVAFLQAFIFTMLSSLFIGMAIEEHADH